MTIENKEILWRFWNRNGEVLLGNGKYNLGFLGNEEKLKKCSKWGV